MAALPEELIEEELIEEILLRLPVKSLLRFKSASKNWYSLLSQNHKFAEFQLKQSASKNLIFYKNYGSTAIFRCSDIDSYESRKINFPVEIEQSSCWVIGSANGLICVALYQNHEGECCYLWNPCTCECKIITVPFPNTKPGLKVLILLGFGYDSISGDYKIVARWDSSKIGIFSLKNNSWKKLEYSGLYPLPPSFFYSNGALHWCVGPQITAFDLAKDEIFYIDLPEGCRYNSAWVPLLTDYQGSLCASVRKSIWVMKEYRNSKSWAKLTTTSLLLPEEYAKPVYISRLGELVFCGISRCVKSDIQGRMSYEDKLQMMEYAHSFLYTESLISPECINPN